MKIKVNFIFNSTSPLMILLLLVFYFRAAPVPIEIQLRQMCLVSQVQLRQIQQGFPGIKPNLVNSCNLNIEIRYLKLLQYIMLCINLFLSIVRSGDTHSICSIKESLLSFNNDFCNRGLLFTCLLTMRVYQEKENRKTCSFLINCREIQVNYKKCRIKGRRLPILWYDGKSGY